jgi:hypothetical protein
VAPSWRFSTAASAEEVRLSTKRSEGASRVYCNPVVYNSEPSRELQPGGRAHPYKDVRLLLMERLPLSPVFFVSIHSKAI